MRKYTLRKDAKKRKGSFPTKSLVNFEEYVDFRERNKDVCNRRSIPRWTDYGRIVSELYSVIGEHIVNNPQGVYIDRLGYFGVAVYKNFCGDIYYFGKEGKFVNDMNFDTDGKIYCLFHVWDDTSSRMHRTFNLDYTFSKKVTKPFSDKLIEGLRYKFNGGLFVKNVYK